MEREITWALIAVLVASVGLAAYWYAQWKRTRQLQRSFGPEYDRVLQEEGDRRRAERTLEMRQDRVRRIEIRPLSESEHLWYAEAWRSQQARFVDQPPAAVEAADRLIADVMWTRGYPVGGFDHQAEDISVDHPHLVENYRFAHNLLLRHQRGEATTEDLRNAMVHYRALFEELLGDTVALRRAG